MNRKKELLEAFFLIILFLFIIAQLVLPETGIGGVLNEGSMAILFFGIGIFCICSIVKKKKKLKRMLPTYGTSQRPGLRSKTAEMRS